MNNEALKLELIEWLTRLEDQKTLESIAHLRKVSMEGYIYDQLTAEQKASYERGLADIVAGRVISSKDLWKEYGREP